MENPDFIQRILDHYTEEGMPVPGTTLTYISTDGERIKFRDHRNINLYVPIALLDVARSRHNTGKTVPWNWVMMHGMKDQRSSRLIKMLMVQFP